MLAAWLKKKKADSEDYDKLVQSAMKNKEKMIFKAFSAFATQLRLNKDLILALAHTQPGLSC